MIFFCFREDFHYGDHEILALSHKHKITGHPRDDVSRLFRLVVLSISNLEFPYDLGGPRAKLAAKLAQTHYVLFHPTPELDRGHEDERQRVEAEEHQATEEKVGVVHGARHVHHAHGWRCAGDLGCYI